VRVSSKQTEKKHKDHFIGLKWSFFYGRTAKPFGRIVLQSVFLWYIGQIYSLNFPDFITHLRYYVVRIDYQLFETAYRVM
jgi:hypothetical protein